MEYSPIALFVFNRPEHTKQVIAALKENIGAIESDLYIFSDAAKSDKDSLKVDEVRHIISDVDGFKSVTIISKDVNQGLAESIISGVSMLCAQAGRVIVLEDDLVTSKYFLEYMNNALNKYKNAEDVMHVSGYMFPVEVNDSESFFLPLTSSWGWATWSRSWDCFESDGEGLYKKLKDGGLFYNFNIMGSYDYKRMLKKQINGKNDSWAIRWYASVFLKNGLGLFPTTSLVKNIGMDDSGVHCSATDDYDINLTDDNREKLPELIEVSVTNLDKLAKFYKVNHKSTFQKIIKKIKVIFQ